MSEIKDDLNEVVETDHLVDAMHWMARTNPRLFRLMAEDFVRGFVMRRSKWSSPIDGQTVEEWLEHGYETQHVAELFPVGTEHEPQALPEAPAGWGGDILPIMMALEQKFGGDHYRWSVATRDQFILLGTVAFGGTRGVMQQNLSIQMGLGRSDRLIGSNVVRAAKIALTRAIHAVAGKDREIFAKAVGNGGRRRHWIFDDDLRQAIAVYCASHPGNIMLPEPDFDTFVGAERLRLAEEE